VIGHRLIVAKISNRGLRGDTILLFQIGSLALTSPSGIHFDWKTILLMRSPILTILTLIAVGLAFIVSSPLQAGASNKNGNPFGNGTYFQTTGTFSAVIRGQNLSGTMLFSSGFGSNSGSNNSSGSCVISYLGSPDGTTAPGVYNGNSAGMWDPSSGSISGQFWGGYTLSGTNSFTNYPELYNTNSFPVIVSVVSNSLITNQVVDPITGNTNTTIITIPVTNTIAVEPVGSNSFQDSVLMNGSFDGFVQNKYPNQVFNAQGTVVQQQLSPPQQGYNGQVVVYDTNPTSPTYMQPTNTNYNQEGTIPMQMAAPLKIPVTVQGIRISDAYSSFATISNAIPYSITTYTITNIAGMQKTQ
jgi:hypothetical protein